MYPNVPEVPQQPAGQPVVPPSQPMYYPPYPKPQVEHPRVAVVGIMNLVFAFPYIALFVLALIGASNPMSALGMGSSYEMDFPSILNLVGFGLGGLLLFIGGLNLLGHKASGKTLTQITAGILTALMAFNAITSLSSLGKYANFGTILGVVLVLGLLLIYPLTAAIVINRTPQELGLE